MIPTFSLCHATARLPLGWCPAFEAWMANCDDTDSVEYIVCVDRCDEHKLTLMPPNVVFNEGASNAVSAWNVAGKAATGRFLITVADDLYPPPHWDTELLKVIPDLNGEYAIEVKCGRSPEDDEWFRCMVHSFLTRAYYDRIGNFFCPEYEGMMADIDYTDMARAHGVVVDARHLTFEHRHYRGSATVPDDEIYQRQNATARYDRGMQVLGRRRESGFKGENH